ncbi:hypothetical protein AC1031_013475 [Aphanomyces cochlioides]|nr:hypothetical protein AC1031_013475 [Aphanomyces cochlioides]
MHVWEILRTVDKWQDLRAIQAGAGNSKRMKLDENDNLVVEVNDRTRPVGTKAAKKAKQSLESDAKSRIVMAESQFQRAQAMNLQAELSLMTVPLDGLTDVAREYILLKQKAVLDRTKNREEVKQQDSDEDSNDEIIETQKCLVILSLVQSTQ